MHETPDPAASTPSTEAAPSTSPTEEPAAAVKTQVLAEMELDSSVEIIEHPQSGELSLQEPPEFSYQPIGTTPYLLRTRLANQHQEIVGPPIPVQPTDEIIAQLVKALEAVNVHNAQHGHPVLSQDSLLMALSRNAILSRFTSAQLPSAQKTRAVQSPAEALFGKRSPFAVAERIEQEARRQGKTLSARNFKRLLRKRLKDR